MPLLVPSAQTSPAPPPSAPSAPPRKQKPATTWTSPAGGVTFLDSGGFKLLPGATGLDMAPFQHYKDESPAVDGALSRGHRALVRRIFLPLKITGSTREEFLRLKRQFLRDVDPKRGPGTLTWAEPDGTRRYIDAYYSHGMEGDYGPDMFLPTWQKFGPEFECLDPYWYGDEVTLEWVGSQVQTFFPLVHSDANFVNLVPSQVLGSTSVDNTGDVEAFPVWTIEGPATSIELDNLTTGKTLTLTTTLTDTQSRVIDSRQGVKTIVDEAGVNKWPELADGSALWHLEPGVNELAITVSGATSDTKAQLTYKPRFEGV